MSNWSPGQRVVCIYSKWKCEFGLPTAPSPRKSAIYTIADILTHPTRPNEIGFNLVEIGGVYWYSSRGFRPIIERKTDISVFQKMLDHPTMKVAAE